MFKWKKRSESKLKNGLKRTEVDIYKANKKNEKQIMSYNEIKKISHDIEKEYDGKYFMRALNQYGWKTIDLEGDVDDDYLDARGYDKNVYGDYYQVQLVIYQE